MDELAFITVTAVICLFQKVKTYCGGRAEGTVFHITGRSFTFISFQIGVALLYPTRLAL